MARKTAADRVRAKTFPVGLRGYDRMAVDAWREEIAKLIDELETQAPRDTVVKRALEEVGQETAAILQRAHEAAEEITTRSRSQAEGRLQRSEAEAEATLKDAEERAQVLERDSKAIWEQRQRLLEEMRQLADEVLAVADDAADRIDPPKEAGPSGDTTDDIPVPDTSEDETVNQREAS
jgi:cell division septum initiation protein DivIVA